MSSIMVLLPAGAAAQLATINSEIASFRDSLDHIVDAESLKSLHTDVRALADSLKGEQRTELRLGFLDLRLAELTGEARFWEEGSRTFEWVARDHPGNSLAWAGYGLASIGEAENGSSGGYDLRKMLGMDPAADIVDRVVKSAGADSTQVAGALEVARLALTTRGPVATEVATRALRLLPRRALVRSAELALARVRVEREYGDKDSAAVVTDIAVRLHRDHPGLLRAQATARFLTGRVDGATPWYRGFRLATAEVFERFVRDLEPVLDDSIVMKLRRVVPEGREEMLRAFWSAQDPDGLPTEDDRLAEHYRRLDFSRHNYLRQTFVDSVVGYDLDTLGLSAFDSRGKIMLLHGSPAKRSSLGRHGGAEVDERMGIIGMPPNESWRYERSDGIDQVYHFMAVDEESDFETVESIFDILINSNQFKMFRRDDELLQRDSSIKIVKTYGAELVSTIAQELMQSRRRLSPIYADILNDGRDGADSLQRLERSIGRQSLAIPYTYELGFELPMAADIDVLAIGSDQGGPMTQISFAVEASDLTGRRLERGYVYPVRMRVAARRISDGELIQVVDTVRGFVTSGILRKGQHLLGQLSLRLPAGSHSVRVAMESGRRGILTPPHLVDVAAPTGSGLSLSDLSLGMRSVPIRWRSPSSDTVWANPLGSFSKEEPIQLYFEVGGLSSGTDYQVTLAIDQLERDRDGAPRCTGRGNALTISSERRHPGVVDRVQNQLALDRLRNGDYMLTATMTTGDGRSVSRCRQFEVID